MLRNVPAIEVAVGQIVATNFAYPIEYDGKCYYVFCRAMQDANKNRLYVHEVFVNGRKKKGDTLQTAASQPHGGIALYRNILANVLEASSETEPQQPNNAVSSGSSLSEKGKRKGINPSEPNGEPTASDRKDSALSSEKQVEKYYGADTIPTDETLWGMSYEQVEEQAALYFEKIAERYDTQIELAEAKESDEEIRSGKKIKILGGYNPETKRIIIFAESLSSKTGTLMTIRHEDLHHQIDTNPRLRKAQQQLVAKLKEINHDIWRQLSVIIP